MADNKTNSGGKITFTEGESGLLTAIMANLTSDIQFDAEAVAKQLGYKDGKIVRTRWSQIRSKKLSGGAASPTGVQKRTPAKKTPKKGKQDGEDGADDEELVSPTKAPTKRGRKFKVEKAAEEEDEAEKVKKEEEEEAVETTE